MVAPDGAYGGPIRVATNVSAELVRQGHDVAAVAGYRGVKSARDLDHVFGKVPHRLFRSINVLPGSGFAGSFALGLLLWILKNARAYDVVHVHFARDLTVLPATLILRLLRVPHVLQTHGMIDPSSRRSARVLDWIATRRLVRGAPILSLTPQEDADLRAVAGEKLEIHRVINGIPSGWRDAASEASSSGTEQATTVGFLARLHARKRPVAFVRMALELGREFPDVTFLLRGPDEGELPSIKAELRAAQEPPNVCLLGPVAPGDVVRALGELDIFVLPSVDEPFPMSVLEALALGKPVVVTDTCGLAPFIRDAKAGIVVGDSQSDLTEGVRALLRDADLRGAMGGSAVRLIDSVFAIEAVIEDVLHAYSSASTGR
ncbi:glycosyltransferase [Microbacterium oleivorans]|uniref:glycosyltransferase n=1 Tax=Microbacterium oleivorans TaxID=273677 RepID=UPI0033DD5CEA